jgi:UDP-N-acetylmuramoyl-tripeptide--D-alanyl-D-alanine ligase
MPNWRDRLRKLGDVRRALKHRTRLLQAQFNRRRSSAKFIVVTGSSGKTTTAQLLTHILSAEHKVRCQSVGNGYFNAIALLGGLSRKHEYVVLEAGTTKPGELDEIMRLYKPDVSIVTLVALEHYSAFRKIEAVASEKAAVVRSLAAGGLAILNHDDPLVRGMSAATTARTTSFGRDGGAYRASDLQILSDGRLTLTISFENQALSLNTRLLGAHNWLPVSAAAACAIELGVAPQKVAERIATFEPIVGRMSIHEVAQGPKFILDTVKAPFHSIFLPLETLRAISAARKRVIIGQISDYRGNSRPRHRDTYRAAREVAQEVIFVGANAHRSQASAEDIAQGRFRAFESVERLSAYLKETAIAGEVILVKSAQNMHLERLLFSMTDDVRCWPNDCGKKIPCQKCGLFQSPFHEHGGKIRPKRKFRLFHRSKVQ